MFFYIDILRLFLILADIADIALGYVVVCWNKCMRENLDAQIVMLSVMNEVINFWY